MHLAESTVPSSSFAAEALHIVVLFDAELDKGLIDAFLHWGYTAPCNLQVTGGLTRKQWDNFMLCMRALKSYVTQARSFADLYCKASNMSGSARAKGSFYPKIGWLQVKSSGASPPLP